MAGEISTMTNTYQWLNKEKSRYYHITVQKSEASYLILNHKWGGCHSNRGGKKEIPVENFDEAQTYINKMIKRRKSRGYELISPKLK